MGDHGSRACNLVQGREGLKKCNTKRWIWELTTDQRSGSRAEADLDMIEFMRVWAQKSGAA